MNDKSTLKKAKPARMSAKEECRLGRLIREGSEKEAAAARESLIMSNLRLVTRLAGDFKGRGVMWNDLIQEGNVGLIRAVDKFDPNRGCRLVAMARWWIKKAMRDAIDKSQIVRIPPRVLAARKKEEEEDDNE